MGKCMDITLKEVETRSKNYFELTDDKECLKSLELVNNDVLLKLKFDSLNLGKKLYGSSKSETVKIQKDNCKLILKFYKKILRKAIIILQKKNLFFGEIYVENLSKKQNNNDFMIESLIIVDFYRFNHHDKIKTAYECAADFLDKENAMNKMCDFRKNKCKKYREKNIDRTIGCCQEHCKLLVPGKSCVHKNLSCKILMCDYLVQKGYYFTPYTLPVLRKNLTPLQILIASGSFFRTSDEALKRFWIVRLFWCASAILLLAIILSIVF